MATFLRANKDAIYNFNPLNRHSVMHTENGPFDFHLLIHSADHGPGL